MFTPKIQDLEIIWDVAQPYTPRITLTGDPLPLVKGSEARRERRLPRTKPGDPAIYLVDWINGGDESWGVMSTEIRDENFDFLIIHDLWLREPLQGIGITHELIRKGYPYWRKRIDYWVVPQWNDASRPVFEHIGFRESDLFPGKYGSTSLIADLKGTDTPVKRWYETQEPSEEDPTG